MIKVIINEQDRIWDSSQAGWLNGTINDLQKDGIPVCVQVSIQYGDINVGLSAGSCSSSSCAGRPPNSRERELITSWNVMTIDEIPLNSGKIISFLNRVKRQ